MSTKHRSRGSRKSRGSRRARHGNSAPRVNITDHKALRIADGWIAGQNDPLYSITSRDGRNIEPETIDRVISNINADMKRVLDLGAGHGSRRYQLGKGTFTKAEIDELRYMRDAFTRALAGGRGVAGARGDASLRRDIIDAMARALFVSAWGSREEERGRSHGGEDLMDIAPATSLAAKREARELAEEIEKDNGKRLDELYEIAAAAPGKHYKDPNPNDFGHYLAMEAMGHGVSWGDNHPAFGLKRLPHLMFDI